MIGFVILQLFLTTITPSVSASATPENHASAAPLRASGLPNIERGAGLAYPAYGSPQPQIVETRAQKNVPAIVTLDAAIAIAIVRVPSLAAARAEVSFNDAAVRITSSGLQPNLNLTGSATRSYLQGSSDSARTLGTAGGGTQSNTANISLAQLIFDGGQVRAKIDASRFTRDAAFALSRRDAQVVAYHVAEEFYTVLQDERTVSVDDQLLAQDVVTENLVRAQIRAGTAAGAELATQLAVTANARTTLVGAQGAVENDRVSFAIALGLDADSDVLPADDAEGLQNATPPIALPEFGSALAVAYAERPDFDQARLTLRSSESSLRAAQRGYLPIFSLAAAKGIASTSPGGGSYLNNGSIGLDIALPLYAQGLTQANVAAEKANLSIATADAATTRLIVQQQVRQALITIVSDRAVLDQTRAAYSSGLEAVRSTQGRYRAGVSTLQAVIQAEATLASAATNIVNAIYTLRLAQNNLRFALGTNLQ